MAKVRKIISASRRIDMVGTQPDRLVHLLQTKTPPPRVHTLVLWTKNPLNLVQDHQLKSTLVEYDQLYLHLTITGMGGSRLEPNVPPPATVLETIPDIIDFIGSPDRLRIRFDPILHLSDANGNRYENLRFFETLAPIMARYHLRHVTTSWMQLYKKIDTRLEKLKIQAIPQSPRARQKQANYLKGIAVKHGITVHGCCVPNWPMSKCIDGALFNRLHPKGYEATESRAKQQRPHCGCTASWDIGWYHTCEHGCVYCYGNPKTHWE